MTTYKANFNMSDFRVFSKNVNLDRFYIFCGVEHKIARQWLEDLKPELGIEDMEPNSAIRLFNTSNSWLYFCKDRKYHIIKKKVKLCLKGTATKKDQLVEVENQ